MDGGRWAPSLPPLHPPFLCLQLHPSLFLPEGAYEYQFLLRTSYAYLSHGIRTCDATRWREGGRREGVTS